MTAGAVRAVIGAVGLLSEHLARRADAGADPAGSATATSRPSSPAWLTWSGPVALPAGVAGPEPQPAGAVSCGTAGRWASPSPGAVLAGLPGDVVIRRGERPRGPRGDDEVGRALPEIVMASCSIPAAWNV